jgi:hypothetical protein
MVTKRRVGGRVTPKGSVSPKRPDGTQPLATRVSARTGPRPKADPAETGRYTRPAPKSRFRPRWHRLAGWVGVMIGVAIFVLNEAMRFSENLILLPFGHSPLYLILSLGVAGSSTWFLGMFDRDPTVYL